MLFDRNAALNQRLLNKAGLSLYKKLTMLIGGKERISKRRLRKKFGWNFQGMCSQMLTTLKGIKDDDNPLDKINEKCRFLKRFLYAHSGFDRSCLQDYLNLFSFISNPPCDHFEKVEKLLLIALKSPNLLKYRDACWF